MWLAARRDTSTARTAPSPRDGVTKRLFGGVLRPAAEDPVPSGHLIRPSEVDDVGSQEGRGRGVGEQQREVALQRAERSPGGRRGGALERAPRAGGGPAAATGEGVDGLARETGQAAGTIACWREDFLQAGQEGLKSRPAPVEDRRPADAQRQIGGLAVGPCIAQAVAG